jgi:riboflavin biosynthesis pyrimidine reductase
MSEGVSIYQELNFPVERAGEGRPYTFINMVTTIDGKILTGKRGEPVQDLGSEMDHLLMRRIEEAADAVLIGSGSQRSTAGLWYPESLIRIVATRTGNVLAESRFFTDAPDRAFVLCTDKSTLPPLPAGVTVQRFHGDWVPWREALAWIRRRLNVRKLLVEGGSDLNAQLLAEELVDELFLTIAPKVKLGEDVPTYADGEALPRERIQEYHLVEIHRVGDEVFLRYRRK